MADVVGGGTGNVTLYDEEGNVVHIVNGQLKVRASLADLNGAVYNETNRLPVDIEGAQITGSFSTVPSVTSALNIPSAPLAANAQFVGDWEDVLPYSAIQVAIVTDAASTLNGAVIEFSADAMNVLRAVPTTIPANFPAYFHLAPQAQYVRIRYMNGPVAQTVLRVSVLFGYNSPADVVQPIGSQTTDANVATVAATHLKGRIFQGPSTGAWTPIGTDGAGRLLVDTELTAGGALGTEASLDAVRVRTEQTVAALGTDGTGFTAPNDGAGARGWLRGIYDRLTSGLFVRGLDNTANGVLTNVGDTVEVDATGSSGFMAHVIPNGWVGSVVTEGLPKTGGTIWIPTAWRQSVTGTNANTLRDTMIPVPANGALLRGSSGGFTKYRVRMVSRTAGSVEVNLTTHLGTTAIFQNTFTDVRQQQAYYATLAGGRTAFNSSVGSISHSSIGEANIAALVNPVGSGVDLHVDIVEVGSSGTGTYRRYRNRTLGALPAPQVPVNRGGGSNAAKGMTYAGTTFTGTGGVNGKTNFIAANTVLASNLDGSLVLREGENLVYTVQGGGGLGGSQNSTVFFDWHEATAAV